MQRQFRRVRGGAGGGPAVEPEYGARVEREGNPCCSYHRQWTYRFRCGTGEGAKRGGEDGQDDLGRECREDVFGVGPAGTGSLDAGVGFEARAGEVLEGELWTEETRKGEGERGGKGSLKEEEERELMGLELRG